MKKLNTPLSEHKVLSLRAGDMVSITGTIYTARDAAHKRIVEAIKKKKALPFDLKNQVIYYAGPTPTSYGMSVGSCGPTTSSRMDSYAIPLLEKGLKGMIGKGKRNDSVTKAIKRFKAIYFLAVGGTGALLATKIKKSEVIAYPELGTEAIRKFEVENFPVVVAIDSKGGNVFEHKN